MTGSFELETVRTMGAFKNLEDLVGDLQAGLVKLRAGELEPEELTPLVDDARELCDRLVLLRFKAHEFAYEVRKKAPEGGVDEAAAERQPLRPFRIGAAYQTSLIDAIEEVSREQAEQAAQARRNAGTPDLFDEVEVELVVDEPAATVEPEPELQPDPVPVEDIVEPPVEPEPEAAVEPEPKSIEVASNPVAEPAVETEPETAVEPVIEPVVEPEAEPELVEDAFEPVAEPAVEPEPAETSGATLFPDAGPTSLAEQMERQPIGDLRTAFSLVEKYECIKGLFQDDALLFDRVLEAMDSAGDAELALHWLRQHVPESKDWDAEDPTVLRFMERVQRRYA